MSEIIDRRISFNAGEMSPWLDPRIDLDKYQMGCRQMENVRGSIYGGAIKRAGTQYLGAALTAATPVRLIPWLGGEGTDYVLEFSDLKLRVWNAATLALVESAPATPLEITTIFADDELEAIQHGQQNDVMYLTHPDHAPQVLVKTATEWLLGNAKFDWPATLGPNTTRTRIFPLVNVYVDTYDNALTYTTGQFCLYSGVVYKALRSTLNDTPNVSASDWAATTWSNGKAYTAGDVILYSGSYYMAISSHTAATGSEPGTEAGEDYYAKGTRIDGVAAASVAAYNSATDYTTGQQVTYNSKIYTRTSFQSGNIDGVPPTGDSLSDEVWAYTGTKSTPAANSFVAAGESIMLEASEALFQSGHVGTTWVIAHQRQNPKSTMRIDNVAAGATSTPVYVLGAFSISTTQVQAETDGLDVEIVIEESSDLVTWETYTGLALTPSNAQQIISGSFAEPVFLRANLLEKEDVNQKLTLDIIPDSSTQYGLVTITAVTDSTHATATVVKPLYRPWPTTRWEEPAFSAVRGYPRAVTLHDGRLWFGGTDHRPTTVWGSTVDAYWDFRLGAEDDRALQYTLATDESSRVEWLVSQDLLVIGTSSSEWVLGQRPGDDDIRLRRNTSFGSAAVQARAISDSVVFIQKSRRKLREFAWSFERDGYLANDLSMLAEHLGDAGMRQIAIQRNPEAVVWIITERGDLLAMTYERGQNVAGWARMVTDGTFESIAILPAENEEDVVWLCVVREIDGNTVRYIERIAPDQLRALKNGETSDLTFSDCAITVELEGNATGDVVVSGLTATVPTLEYVADVESRPSFAADGTNYTLAAEKPKAYGTLNPAGANNDIFIEAVTGGAAGNSITGEITVSAREGVDVSVVGTDILAAASTKQRMILSGDLVSNGVNLATVLSYLDDPIYGKCWSSNGNTVAENATVAGATMLLYVGAAWFIYINEDGSGYQIHTSDSTYVSFGGWPDDGVFNTSKVVTVTAQTSKASDVITAINADVSASALVVASNAPGSTGAGTVAAVGPITLANGSNTVRWRLTAAGNVWLAASTETYPWDILPGDWSAVSPATGTPTILPAESTITGLDHLEGMEVVILADGSVHRPLTVASGEVALDYPVAKAVVGLPYTATLEPTFLETPQVAGFSKAAKKRIHRIITETWKTAGLEISVDDGATWKPIETRTLADLMDSNRPLITGLREEFVNGSTARQISVILRSADPLPMMLQSLHIRYQIDAK